MDGVFLIPLKEIQNPNGNILHFIKLHDLVETKIGEVYFSEILPGCIKAWKLHSRQTQKICIPIGLVKVCLIDLREDSLTYREIKEFLLGRSLNHSLLSIPPGIAYGYKCLDKMTSLIANAPDIPHDTEEQITVIEENLPFYNF
jgi:dTDP-4-dehydrorhamnose 3,5-epimerase